MSKSYSPPKNRIVKCVAVIRGGHIMYTCTYKSGTVRKWYTDCPHNMRMTVTDYLAASTEIILSKNKRKYVLPEATASA